VDRIPLCLYPTSLSSMQPAIVSTECCRTGSVTFIDFWRGSCLREPPTHAGVDPKFSVAAAFGAPIEFCRRRRRHRKSGGGGAIGTAQTSTQKCHFLYWFEQPLQQFCTTAQTVMFTKHCSDVGNDVLRNEISIKTVVRMSISNR